MMAKHFYYDFSLNYYASIHFNRINPAAAGVIAVTRAARMMTTVTAMAGIASRCPHASLEAKAAAT